jgi:uncharacterized protein (TIGR03435 family)
MRFTSLFCLGALLAQAQTFEVASVKPAAPYKGGPIHIGTSGGPGTGDPGRLTYSNATIMMLLTDALDVPSYRIAGPNWINVDMFDITAKVPPGTTKEQMRTMLLNLLTERFGMMTHREKQDLPAYVLTVGKGGPKMTVSDPIPPAGKAPPSGPKSSPGVTRITCRRCTMARFVNMLGNPGGRLVFDETGLAGTYDFTLVFEPEIGKCKDCVVGGGNGALPPPPVPAASVDAPPILEVAVREQLGLKLEREKTPVDVVVIDRIEKIPTGN